MKKVIGYAFYCVVTTVFFLVHLFPATAVTRYLEDKILRSGQGVKLHIAGVEPALPLGLRLARPQLVLEDTSWLEAQDIVVAPEFLPLFKGRVVLRIEARAYGGRIEATVDLEKRKLSGPVAVDATVSGLDVASVEGLRRLAGRTLSGKMNGSVTWSAKGPDWTDATGSGRIVVTEGHVEVLGELFAIRSIAFKKLELEMELADRTVTFKRWVLTGRDLNGNATGTITLAPPLKTSAVRLKGSVMPSAAFIQQMGGGGKMTDLLRKNVGKEGFSFRISGPLEQPQISFK